MNSLRFASAAVVLLLATLVMADETDDDAPATGSSDASSQEAGEAAERKAVQQRLMEISCRDAAGRPEGWLDLTHSWVSQRLCEPAAWFDGFFGDPRTLEENPVGSFIRLRNQARWDETEGLQYRVQVRANLILPHLSERLRLLVARDEDLEGDFNEIGRFDDPDNRTRLGLRFIADEQARSRFDLDGTVRLSGTSLNPRIRGRYRYIRGLTDRTLGRFTQSAFWEREDGFGLTSRLDWEWLPNRDRLVRWTGQGTWSEASDGIDWQTALVSFRQFDRRSAARVEVGAYGYTEPSFETESYYAAVRYRRQFLRHWLYWEIQPEHAWPLDERTGSRRGDWRLTLTLEVQFENPRSRRERLRRYIDEADNQRDWTDEPIPVDAPGDRVEDPLLDPIEESDGDGEAGNNGNGNGNGNGDG